MTTLIKNGTLITASETFNADILIEGEINFSNRKKSATSECAND